VSGTMTDLVYAIEGRFPSTAAVAALPAAIGLLPMPGGALFSAPLIDQYDRENHLSGDLKTQINYWFRHIWEFWWPLYPGVILAVDLSGLPLLQFCGLQIPLTLSAIAAGYFFFLRKLPTAFGRSRSVESPSLGKALFPVFLVIVLYGVISLAFPGLGSYMALWIGMAAALVFVLITRPQPLRVILREAFSLKALNMMVIVAVIRIYGAFVETAPAGGAAVTEMMRSELLALGIPIFLLIMILPFITGLATGISIGFVGASFPIVLSLMGGGEAPPLAGVFMAYLAGFSGIMMSPVHLCLVVTGKHYRSSITKTLAMIGPVMLATAGAGALYYGLIWFLTNR